MSQYNQSATRTVPSAWRTVRCRFNSGRGSVAAIAGVGLAGMIVGAALAKHGDPHGNPAVGKPDAPLNALLKFGTPPKTLVAVFAVALDGTVQPYYLADNGRRAPWEDIQNPLAEFDIEVEIGNPKVCWKTTGGGQECVVY
jgi:hypothetical protein